MHHLSRALATARIDDLLRDAAQMHMIRLARHATHDAHVAASNVADNDAIAGVAPVAHAHVNSLGRYDLNRQPPAAGQLRPLRLVEDIDRVGPTPPLGDPLAGYTDKLSQRFVERSYPRPRHCR